MSESGRSLRIAIIGCRGIPAHYGGFESFAEELAPRLAEMGNDVTVYCRRGYTGADAPGQFRGVRLRYTPYLRVRSLETLSHEFTAILDSLARPFDLYYFLGTRSSPFYLLARLRGRAVVVHTDGLEWKRRKWSRLGRRYLMFAERFAARSGLSDALVTDSSVLRDYYLRRYGRESRTIGYGADVFDSKGGGGEILTELGVESASYYLVVGRLEPENNIDLIVREFLASGSAKTLLIVGGASYETSYVRQLRALARPGRVVFAGSVYGDRRLEALYAGAFAYIHGHEVGGTNPSLVRAMGCGACCLALDTPFNAETLDGAGLLWAAKKGSLASDLHMIESDEGVSARGLRTAAAARAKAEFTWPNVAALHERLFREVTKS